MCWCILRYSKRTKKKIKGASLSSFFFLFCAPWRFELQLLRHSKARRHQFQGRTGSLCVRIYSTEILHQCICVCMYLCVRGYMIGSTRETTFSQWSTWDLRKQSFTMCVCGFVFVCVCVITLLFSSSILMSILSNAWKQAGAAVFCRKKPVSLPVFFLSVVLPVFLFSYWLISLLPSSCSSGSSTIPPTKCQGNVTLIILWETPGPI